MGTTEGGFTGVQLMHDGGKDWPYFYFDPDLSDVDFREHSEGIYEAVQVRNPKNERYHAIWNTFPDLQERTTSDLYSKHPTKPNLWRFEGRTDDLVTFLGGQKHNPVLYEEAIRTHPSVLSALVIGTGRRQPALLVELREDAPTAQEKVLQSLLPTIEKANVDAPRHAVVKPSHVMFAASEKPFKRASKGTVQRAPTLRDYADEINELYTREGDKKLDNIDHLTGNGYVNGR